MPAGEWTAYAINNLDKDAAREKLIQNPRHVKLAQACQWLERNAAQVSKIRKHRPAGIGRGGGDRSCRCGRQRCEAGRGSVPDLGAGPGLRQVQAPADARGQAVAQLKGQIT